MNIEEVEKNKDEAIKVITNYLNNCMTINENIKKVNIISYWLKDYINYIREEENFNPIKLKTYERGDIIKVNLGFNIGSELGGLHYCVVIDKKNNRNSPIVTIVPLSSQKTQEVNKNSIILGNDIYKKMICKSNEMLEKNYKEIKEIQKQLENESDNFSVKNNLKIEYLNNKIMEWHKKMKLIEKINKEIDKMKYGSVAIVNQVRAVSKQRIYIPKTDDDVLAGIKLSNDNLNLIDKKLQKLFVKCE